MDFLQGDQFDIAIKIKDSEGVVVRAADVERVQFVFDGYECFYEADGSGDASWDDGKSCFVVPISEDGSFNFEGVVEYQVRVKFADGQIRGSVPKCEYLYDSVTRARIGGSEADE